MRTILPTAPAILMILGVLLATPDTADAADCGGSYVECLNRTGAIESSEALHEMECYAAYWECVSGQLLLY